MDIFDGKSNGDQGSNADKEALGPRKQSWQPNNNHERQRSKAKEEGFHHGYQFSQISPIGKSLIDGVLSRSRINTMQAMRALAGRISRAVVSRPIFGGCCKCLAGNSIDLFKGGGAVKRVVCSNCRAHILDGAPFCSVCLAPSPKKLLNTRFVAWIMVFILGVVVLYRATFL